MTQSYCIEVLNKNGAIQKNLREATFHIKNISKGGFCFLSDVPFELEDRLEVKLHFPDKHCQQVLGRICYSEPLSNKKTAYFFSVIDGFYSLRNQDTSHTI